MQTKQRFSALQTALARLPHDQREILLLREVEDVSYSEINAALAISEGTVKSRLARAREALIEFHKRKDV